MFQREAAPYSRRGFGVVGEPEASSRKGATMSKSSIRPTTEGVLCLRKSQKPSTRRQCCGKALLTTARWVTLATSRPSTGQVPSSSWCGKV